jgi:hypothetical protein
MEAGAKVVLMSFLRFHRLLWRNIIYCPGLNGLQVEFCKFYQEVVASKDLYMAVLEAINSKSQDSKTNTRLIKTVFQSSR